MTEDSSRPSGDGSDKIAAGVEQARRDLSGSLQELMAKADVPARVRDKAGQAREKAGQVREKAGQARDKTGHAREKAGQARGQVTGTLSTLNRTARDTAVRTTRQVTDAVEKRPAILYAAAGACTAAGLLRRGRGQGRGRGRGRGRWT